MIAKKKDEYATSCPFETAKTHLVDALRSIKKVKDFKLDWIPEVIDLTSQSHELLAQVDPNSDVEKINASYQCMIPLRRALKILHGTQSTSEWIASTSELVAKATAILYPLSMLSERRSQIPGFRGTSLSKPILLHERRTAQRISIDADVGFQSETNFFTGFTEDISSGGLFIATYDIRDIGSDLTINFTLPDGQPICAEGKVRWVRDYNETSPDVSPGMGVQFDNLSIDDQSAIHRFIEERPPLFYAE